MLPEEIRKAAFKATNGEFGWTRAQVPEVVRILREQRLAILGGEVWWVLDGARAWNGSIPQHQGVDAVYAWETMREPPESWLAFVNRCAAETVAAVEKWPGSGDLRPNLPGRILYNLTWVGEAEYGELGSRAV